MHSSTMTQEQFLNTPPCMICGNLYRLQETSEVFCDCDRTVDFNPKEATHKKSRISKPPEAVEQGKLTLNREIFNRLKPCAVCGSKTYTPIPGSDGELGYASCDCGNYCTVPPDTKKVTFPSGAERGTEAIRGWYMLSQIALRRYCDAMQEGSVKYKPFNYLKGIPVTNLIEHLYTHLSQFLQGDSSEDHLGHAFWNLATIIHFSETRLDLFEGLPPGCKEAMVEWLQSTDEGSGRNNAVNQAREVIDPSDLIDGGQLEMEADQQARASSSREERHGMTQHIRPGDIVYQDPTTGKYWRPLTNNEMLKRNSELNSAFTEAKRWNHVYKRERDEWINKAQAYAAELTSRQVPSPTLAGWLETEQRNTEAYYTYIDKTVQRDDTRLCRDGWDAAFMYLIDLCLKAKSVIKGEIDQKRNIPDQA